MGTITLDGKTRVAWFAAADTPADLDAITVAEFAASTDLQGSITPDGLQINATTGKIDNSNLGSTFTTNTNGRTSFDAMLKLHRNSVAGDVIRELLFRDAVGTLVVRRGVPKATAWTAGQEYKAYPTECGEENDPTSAAEQNWDYEVPITVSDDPSTRGVVAA